MPRLFATNLFNSQTASGNSGFTAPLPPSTFDPSADMQVFDGVEKVSVIHVNPNGSTVTYANVVCLRREITANLSGQSPAQAPPRAVLHLQASTIPISPVRGDQIVSSTTGTWLITGHRYQTFLSRHRCEAVLQT